LTALSQDRSQLNLVEPFTPSNMSFNGSSNSSSRSDDGAQAVQPVVVTAADTVLVVESAAVTEMAPVPAAVNEDEDEDEDKDDGPQAAAPTAGGLYKDIFGSDLSASESEDEDDDEEERPTATGESLLFSFFLSRPVCGTRHSLLVEPFVFLR
jgi:hypothetical protein